MAAVLQPLRRLGNLPVKASVTRCFGLSRSPAPRFLLKILILRALVRKFRGPLDSPRGRIEHRIPSKATAVRMFSPPGTSQLGSA
eukprot:s1047_g10.t1